MFFVEAKKPSVNIKNNKESAFQLRRYQWSSKLSLSILTNFEDFFVYSARQKPRHSQRVGTERIIKINYKDYINKWEKISNIFSKNAVLQGSFDNYAINLKKQRGTQEVDDEFLVEIEQWREEIARNIALRNTNLNVRELNAAVQKTIDRIIFLRMCEDRGIEKYAQLKKIAENNNIYKNLCKIFLEADKRYNSGLFHFKKEKGRSTSVDEFTLNLTIDDRVLKNIFRRLYYPNSPYEFSVISPEILGNVYEQFLGKIIRLTSGHRAKIEEKPEVKKAGGVYYTPQYIVDYIVKNTLGKQITGKKPSQISKIKILDPACGSGSFLIGAFSYLLNYHLDFYVENRSKKRYKDRIYQGKNNQWFLTIQEKKRILLNNIFGVDIDNQAVEVTKLSLLLKVLEGETKDVFERQQKLWTERALPDLGYNIKCGNSLVSSDFFDGTVQNTLTKDEIIYDINPFNWKVEFEKIIDDGGFDIILGNPPWGYVFSDEELEYLKNKNREIIVRMIDSFMYFIYQTSSKLKKNGKFGMILPDVLLYQGDNFKLRKYILSNYTLQNIVNLGNNIFKKVTRPACICVFNNLNKSNTKYSAIDISSVKRENKERELNLKTNEEKIQQKIIENLDDQLFISSHPEWYEVLIKIKKKTNHTLKDIVDSDGIQRGVSPDLKDAFVVDSDTIKKYDLEKKKLRDVLIGGHHVKPYSILYPDLKIIYTSKKDDFKSLKNICSYIDIFKDKITCSEVREGKHPLYSLHRPRKEKIFLKDEKFVGVITSDKPKIAIDESKYFCLDGLYLFGIKDNRYKYYLLGLLNSKLMTFLYRLLSFEKGRVLAQVKPKILYELPIIIPDLNEKQGIDYMKKFNNSVNSLMAIKNDYFVEKTDHGKKQLERQITTLEKSIDRLIFDLYGLDENESVIIRKNS